MQRVRRKRAGAARNGSRRPTAALSGPSTRGRPRARGRPRQRGVLRQPGGDTARRSPRPARPPPFSCAPSLPPPPAPPDPAYYDARRRRGCRERGWSPRAKLTSASFWARASTSSSMRGAPRAAGGATGEMGGLMSNRAPEAAPVRRKCSGGEARAREGASGRPTRANRVAQVRKAGDGRQRGRRVLFRVRGGRPQGQLVPAAAGARRGRGGLLLVRAAGTPCRALPRGPRGPPRAPASPGEARRPGRLLHLRAARPPRLGLPPAPRRLRPHRRPGAGRRAPPPRGGGPRGLPASVLLPRGGPVPGQVPPRRGPPLGGALPPRSQRLLPRPPDG